MTIDLPKDLSASYPAASGRKRTRFTFVHLITLVCILNTLAVIAVLFMLIVRPLLVTETYVTEAVVPEIGEETHALLSRLSTKIEDLERNMHDVRDDNRQIKSDLAAFRATRSQIARDERLQQRATRDGVTRRERTAVAPPADEPARVRLTEEERQEFDRLIDTDQTGARTESFLRAQSPEHQEAYLRYMRDKGDLWADAALNAIQSFDDAYEDYADNAEFFYTIISRVSDDTALLAYVNGRRSNLTIAEQGIALREELQYQQTVTAEQIEQLQTEEPPPLTRDEARAILREQRRQNIRQYRSSGIVHPYETDWDPDPRVRLERQREEEARGRSRLRR